MTNRTLMVIMVCLVAAILIVAFLAIVGIASPEDDFGPESDPLDLEREPIAFGNFYVKVGVDNQLNKYYAVVEAFEANIYPYTMYDKNDVFSVWKANPLGWLTSDNIIVDLKVTITGPGKYQSVWEDSTEIRLGEIGWAHPEFQSGNTEFWDEGAYRATVQVYLSGEEMDGLACSQTFTFNVSG